MKRKAECPVCNTNLLTNGSGGNWEKAILPNRDLESKVDLYREGVRGELRRSLVRLDVLERRERMRNSEQNGGNDDNEQKQPAAAEISMSSLKRARRSTANYKREYSSDHDGNEVDADETMTSSDTNGASIYSQSIAPKQDGRTAAASAAAASSVPQAAAASINNHNIQQHQPQRKRKPTISYHNLKRKQLLNLCTTENLPTTGTDTELKHRHSEYILLYNSQCDSQHPMSEREVVVTVMKEEKGRKREARKTTTGSKKVNGEMERKFKEMIESVKARKNGGGVSDSSSECKEGGGVVVPSCIAAAAAAVVNGSSGSNGNNASKPRAKSGNDVSVAAASTASAVAAGGDAPSMKAAAAASTSSRTTTTTPRKSITNNVQKKATPSKSRASKKQATISSAAKKKSCGIWKCQTCTFENHKYTTATALCEMCGTPRPEKENTSNEVISIDC